MKGGVLFFLPDFNGGGAERAACNLLRAWPVERRESWRPIVVVRNPGGPLRGLVPDWVEVISLDLDSSGVASSVLSVKRLAAIVRRERPRVLITLLSFPAAVAGARLGNWGTKIVVSVQNPFAASSVGFAPGKKRSPLVWPACRLAAPLVDRFWAISPGIAEEYRNLFKVPAARLAVLPNSVDLECVGTMKQLPVESPAFADPAIPVIATVGRLVQQKRIDVLLSAVALVASERPVNLVVLGEGPLRQALEERARALGIADRVSFLGFQENPWRFVARARAFALASDFEGFGNVLIEAMACGTPVVATRAPFGPEFVLGGGECGRLVPCGDAAAMAQGLRELLWDSKARERYIERGMRRAQDFDVAVIRNEFWRLLAEVTGTAPQEPNPGRGPLGALRPRVAATSGREQD